jgi:hypothetical protein
MPPGDTITLDYQLELRGVLMGVTTVSLIGKPGIKGLGLPPVKSADVDLEGADGAYATKDYRGPRVVTIPLDVVETSPAAAMNTLATLATVFAPSLVDIPLYIRLPGWGKFHVNGRPRGLDEDLVDLKSSTMHILATFLCPNPTITIP